MDILVLWLIVANLVQQSSKASPLIVHAISKVKMIKKKKIRLSWTFEHKRQKEKYLASNILLPMAYKKIVFYHL
jgi:hypothetical protein